jgi:hypothetical protein
MSDPLDPFNPGRALAHMRWDRLTAEQRVAAMANMTRSAAAANRAAGDRRRRERRAAAKAALRDGAK